MSQSEVRKQRLIVRVQAGAILLLLLACSMLILRDRRRTAEFAEQTLSVAGEHQEVTSIETTPPDSVARLRQNAPEHEVSTQRLAEGRRTVLTSEVIRDTRYDNLKLVALHYAKYFATAKLTHEKARMLLDLLVDQSMVLVEAGPQTGGANEYGVSGRDLREQAVAQNRALIEQLVGGDEAGKLEAAAAEQKAALDLRELIEVIGGGDAVPLDVQQQLPALIGRFDATSAVSRFLESSSEFNSEIEANMRAEYAKDLASTLARLHTVLSDEQIEKLRRASDQKFEGGLLLIRILAAEKAKKG